MIPLRRSAYLHDVYGELVNRVASSTISSAVAPNRTRAQVVAETHDTRVSGSLRQIGHITELGLPWNLAARSR